MSTAPVHFETELRSPSENDCELTVFSFYCGTIPDSESFDKRWKNGFAPSPRPRNN